MKLHIKIATWIFCLLLPIFIFGLYKHNKTFYIMSRGNYFFQDTRNNINLETILLNFGKDNTITVTLKDGLWRIKEADDYFASSFLVKQLFNFINNTVIYRTDTIKESDYSDNLSNSIKITSFDNKGVVLNSAIVSLNKNASGYLYATLDKLPYLYQLNGRLNISPLLFDWVHTPILAISYDSIKRIDSTNFSVYRRFSEDTFKSIDSPYSISHIKRLTNNLYNVVALEIKHISNLNLSKLSKLRHYDITLFNGLIYRIDIYKDTSDYWINIKLDSAIISDDIARQIIKEKTILYDGWFFKIDKDIGHIISNFIL